ncbi:MAG: M20/M25/M40 family metallo-hydrolase [Bacteroidales bacterium]|nr:M20/M25/M40 family metallo-hydrolase [Bacteroidales bacterium]
MNIHSKQDTIDTTEMLKSLIEIPSYSGKEGEAADFLEDRLKKRGLSPSREKNNIWLLPGNFSEEHPNVLLNAHIDTVKPSESWTMDPHQPMDRGKRIYGLGSNDAGASLVCLLDTFMHFSEKDIPLNIIFSATAEEETGGNDGVQSIIEKLPEVSLGIIGEPTGMQMAVGERGLLVIDGKVAGSARHAALENPDNAILNAMEVLNKLQNIRFEKVSEILGGVQVTVSEIYAGMQHNVTPSECRFVLDIRMNERYTPREILEILEKELGCSLKARSLDKKASGIPLDHPIVKSAKALKIKQYGSSTLSNMACVPFPSVKIGPGESSRSHKPDEFVYTHELYTGKLYYKRLINQYISLL